MNFVAQWEILFMLDMYLKNVCVVSARKCSMIQYHLYADMCIAGGAQSGAKGALEDAVFADGGMRSIL